MIDLLKIDAVGAELQVLTGARRMLAERRVRRVTFEFGLTTFDMGNSPDQIDSCLKEVGYGIRSLVEGDPVCPEMQGVQTAPYSMHVATPTGATPL